MGIHFLFYFKEIELFWNKASFNCAAVWRAGVGGNLPDSNPESLLEARSVAMAWIGAPHLSLCHHLGGGVASVWILASDAQPVFRIHAGVSIPPIAFISAKFFSKDGRWEITKYSCSSRGGKITICSCLCWPKDCNDDFHILPLKFLSASGGRK